MFVTGSLGCKEEMERFEESKEEGGRKREGVAACLLPEFGSSVFNLCGYHLQGPCSVHIPIASTSSLHPTAWRGHHSKEKNPLL